MLADSIEAAVRSMKDPTPKEINQYIERLVRGKIEDGQLSECPLSLQDIDQICEAFSGILKGVYHERVEYPKVEKYAVQNGTKTGPVQNDNGAEKKSEQSVQEVTQEQNTSGTEEKRETDPRENLEQQTEKENESAD